MSAARVRNADSRSSNLRLLFVSGGSIGVLSEDLPFELWTIGGGPAFKKRDYVDLLSLLHYLVRLATT
jgi:hypothetical protein